MVSNITQFEKDGKTFPMLVLNKDENKKFPFQFGIGKARLILSHIEDIKSFVTQYGGE